MVDTATPVQVNVYWNVKKEDLYHIYSPSISSTSKQAQPTKYEALSDREDNTLVIEESSSFPVHFSHSTNEPTLLPEGLKQTYMLPRNSWVPLSAIQRGITPSNNVFSMVIVISKDPPLPESPLLVGIVEMAIVDDDSGHITVTGSVTDQYLWTEKEIHVLSDVYGMDEEDCVVCLTEPKDTTLLPCNHYCVCHTCFSMIETCPICRAKIDAFLHFITEEEEERDSSLDDDTGEAEIEISQGSDEGEDM